jgi:hypothetical protein
MLHMSGIDINTWSSAVIAFAARSPAELAGHVPLLDPGPAASVVALALALGFAFLQRRASLGRS